MPNDVVLDPGHGGLQQRGNSTPDGARFGSGQTEKQINFALAQRVAHHLGGAHLTRAEDENRALGERIEQARRAGARAFVSLHSNPGGSTGVWVHPRAGQGSQQLAEMIRAQLAPVHGGAQVTRGELAVLSPEHHDRGTAACLVELGVGSGAGLEGAAAAIARGVRGHLGRASYGRAAPARSLETNLPADASALREWHRRQQAFRAGVAETRAFPFSAVCKLQGTMDGTNWFGGTGFYISPNRILTAGHCVYMNRQTVTQMQITPGLNGSDQPFAPFTISGTSSFVPHPQWSGDGGSGRYRPDFDIGVIKVDGNPPPNGQYFDHLDTRPMSISMIEVVGYSADTVDPDVMHADGDMIRGASQSLEVIDYNAIMEHGASGGPVFYFGYEDPASQMSVTDIGVVGVNVTVMDAQRRRMTPYNGASRLTDAKVNWIWSV